MKTSISVRKEDLDKARRLFTDDNKFQEISWVIFKDLLEFYIKNKEGN